MVCRVYRSSLHETPGLTLHPTLHLADWVLKNRRSSRRSWITLRARLRWDATYNVIAPAEDVPEGQRLDMSGWVNVTNESGADFRDSSLQLMAGDISKLVNANGGMLF